MSAAEYILSGYRNFARFSGRTARAEYWTFAAFLFVAFIVTLLTIPVLGLAFAVLSALPGLSAAMRRLHDTGRSGWWLVVPAVVLPAWLLVWIASAASALAVGSDPLDDPIYFLSATAAASIVCGIVALWLAQPSEPGSNRYGPNPFEVTS